MYYNILLETWEKSETLDKFHFKMAHCMKRLLIIKLFLSSRHLAKHGQCLKGSNFTKYEHRAYTELLTSYWQVCYFRQFEESLPAVYCTTVRWLHIKYCSNKNKHFIRNNCSFETFALWWGRKILILLKTFFMVFEYPPLGNFWLQLLFKIQNLVFVTPPQYGVFHNFPRYIVIIMKVL